MADAPAKGLTPLAKLVLLLGIALFVVGAAWHGVTLDDTKRLWRDLFERPGGAMSFRFVLQPVMAAIAAAHDGMADARAHRTPYLRSLLQEPENRGARLSEGFVSTARIMLLGLAMDMVYQWRALDTFYPGEAVLIALALGFLPYLLLRGLITRAAHRWMRRHPPPNSHQGASR
jgi:hypothetical protein